MEQLSSFSSSQAWQFFFGNFKLFTRQYPGLFSASESEGDVIDETDEKTDDTFMDQWGWFVSISAITKLRNIKWEEVMELRAIEFCNTLSYLKADSERMKREYDKLKRKTNRGIRK